MGPSASSVFSGSGTRKTEYLSPAAGLLVSPGRMLAATSSNCLQICSHGVSRAQWLCTHCFKIAAWLTEQVLNALGDLGKGLLLWTPQVAPHLHSASR